MTPQDKETTVLAAAPPAQNGFTLISNEKLLHIYSTMLKCRILRERVHSLVTQNEPIGKGSAIAGSVPVSHEAVAAGVAIDLLPEDTLAPHPGDLIPLFVKDLQLSPPLHSLSSPLKQPSATATQLKIATDAAMLNKLASNKKIAVAFSNESVFLDPWHEALRFAVLHDLPMIFVSWNHPPLKAKGNSFPNITVDGNDAVAVYRVACEAIAHARRGNGPTLIACQTDRRSPGDPILNMEQYLTRKGLFSEEFKKEEKTRFTRTLDSASTFPYSANTSASVAKMARRVS